jgi:hypothetical protein
MPDKPLTANTQDLANTEYDAELRGRIAAEHQPSPSAASEALSPPPKSSPVDQPQQSTEQGAIPERGADV